MHVRSVCNVCLIYLTNQSIDASGKIERFFSLSKINQFSCSILFVLGKIRFRLNEVMIYDQFTLNNPAGAGSTIKNNNKNRDEETIDFLALCVLMKFRSEIATEEIINSNQFAGIGILVVVEREFSSLPYSLGNVGMTNKINRESS